MNGNKNEKGGIAENFYFCTMSTKGGVMKIAVSEMDEWEKREETYQRMTNLFRKPSCHMFYTPL